MGSDEAELRARLESNFAAFEGMMSLTPAKYYYGEDDDTKQDQWQKKKQTKEEKRAAKKAKLNPDAYKSALDVHREKELKRKREVEGEEEAGVSQGSQGLASADGTVKLDGKPSKKQKVEQKEASMKILTPEENEASRKQHAEKRKEKRNRKTKKNRRRREALEAAKSKKALARKATIDVATTRPEADSTSDLALQGENSEEDEEVDGDGDAGTEVIESPAMPDSRGIEEQTDGLGEDARELGESFEMEGFNDDGVSDSEVSSQDDASTPETPTFDSSGVQSSSSSISSIIPPSDPSQKASAPNQEEEADQKEGSADSSSPRQRTPKLPQINSELLKQRLEARIAALRAARKADGPDGKPARNRQELIDARHQKEEKRKTEKKELRARARAQANEAEAEAARLRGSSGSPLWSTPSLLSPQAEQSNNFSFGRVAFDDGEQLDSSMSGTFDPSKKKGPQDPKSALEAAKKKKAHINSLDETKRNDVKEKERWLNAKKRIHGEKVRDDTSLLKKTLKRQQKGKKKSEHEWGERAEGIKKSMEIKQKRREDNLAKRRDEKGGKGKGKPKGKLAGSKFLGGGGKKRAGFEGSLKTGKRTS